jgi:heme/copper-type cytochrome/quinol oxidase subunit 2
MNRKQLIILVVVGVVVVIGILFGVFGRKQGGFFVPVDEKEKKEGEVTMPVGDTEVSVFTTEVPGNAELTVPQEKAPAAPGAEEKLGIFNMTVSSSGFSPNSITVNKGDVVQIRLTAQGGDYDLSMPYKGLYVMVPENETKQITFGINTTGTYNFMCRDYCPGGRTINGELIVLP